MPDTPEQRKNNLKKLLPPLCVIIFGMILVVLGLGVLKIDAIGIIGFVALFAGLIYLVVVGLVTQAKREIGEVAYPNSVSTPNLADQSAAIAQMSPTNTVPEINNEPVAPFPVNMSDGPAPTAPVMPMNSEPMVKVFGSEVNQKQAMRNALIYLLGGLMGAITFAFIFGGISTIAIFFGISGSLPYFIAAKKLKNLNKN